MNSRSILLAAPLALLAACGGSNTGSSGTIAGPNNALAQAAPSYAALSMDEVSADSSTSLTPSTALVAVPAALGDGCHPHLFIRQREVVERVNRHIYKALFHVEKALRKLAKSSETSSTWDTVEGGIERKFTVALVPGTTSQYTWELDIGPQGGTLDVAFQGQIDRTNATGPHQGTGSFHIDFAKLAVGYPTEKVNQGTLDVQFDTETSKRQLNVYAYQVAWQLDPTLFADANASSAVTALEAQLRTDSYVYYREPGKGGSLKIADQMVFLCPDNPSNMLADAQLITRWYVTGGAVHGRSDALMTGGQLTSTQQVVAVTCHQAATDGGDQSEGFWLMKLEDGGTVVKSAESTSGTTPACDTAFGAVPDQNDVTGDLVACPTPSPADGNCWPAALSVTTPWSSGTPAVFANTTPVSFPNM